MLKIHREFFDDGFIKKELYYDEATTIVSEIKRYSPDGSLLLHMQGDGSVKLEDALQEIPTQGLDASYVDEDALRAEESRERLERAREVRLAAERLVEERRRVAADAEARLKAAERFIGRQLGSNDLC